jgi:hypothetical protein
MSSSSSLIGGGGVNVSVGVSRTSASLIAHRDQTSTTTSHNNSNNGVSSSFLDTPTESSL